MGITIESAAAGGPRSVRTCFLIGAPRCGTTFLAKALARHPSICFSKPKETHFFVRDYASIAPERWQAEFLRRYFAHLEPGHELIAEGSPLQLRDPEAIERLLRKTGIAITRYGPPLRIGVENAVALDIDIGEQTHRALFGELAKAA